MTAAGWAVTGLAMAALVLFWGGLAVSMWERTVEICFGPRWGHRLVVAGLVLAPVAAVAAWLVDLDPALQWRVTVVALAGPVVLLAVVAVAVLWVWARGQRGDAAWPDARPEERP